MYRLLALKDASFWKNCRHEIPFYAGKNAGLLTTPVHLNTVLILRCVIYQQF